MSSTQPASPINDNNRLGLDYRAEAERLPWRGGIWDVHTHIADPAAAERYFEAASLYGVERVWTMTQLEQVDAIRDAFGDRIAFIAVPNYEAKDEPDTFTTDWLRRIEGFAKKGCKVCKFWAAPRGVDFAPGLALDSPVRREGMRLARDAGMMFMTHVADPDTWFATRYQDSAKYGTKAEHHAVFERMLDEFGDVTWIAAHMAGNPEDLDHLQGLLDRHANLYLDTSATKWMVRELSKHPGEFLAFCKRNPGRVLFGSDVVASPNDPDERWFDLYASRYWALRTLYETGYDGPSPIVDPDIAMVDPTQAEDSTARLCGAGFDEGTLRWVYRDAAKRVLVDGGSPVS